MRWFKRCLGKDCDGKKLYAGDLVMLAPLRDGEGYDPIFLAMARGRRVFQIIGPGKNKPRNWLDIDVPHPVPKFKYFAGKSDWLKKIEDKPKDQETGSWEEVFKNTGWIPGTVAPPVQAPENTPA